MAARLNPRHSELVLKRIQTSQLVNRLQNNALGKLKVPMSDGQIRSACFLIERTLCKAEAPVEIDPDSKLVIEFRHTGVPNGQTHGG